MSAMNDHRFSQRRIIVQRNDAGQMVRATDDETGETIPVNAETGAIMLYGYWYVLAPTTETVVFAARDEP